MVLKWSHTRRLCNSLLIIITLGFIHGCSGDKSSVLNQLDKCYYDNAPVFSSLASKLNDTSYNVENLNLELKSVKLKAKEGNDSLHYTPYSITVGDYKTFIVNGFGYGGSFGFFYSSSEIRNHFENSRMVYRRIQDKWFSFIYFN